MIHRTQVPLPGRSRTTAARLTSYGVAGEIIWTRKGGYRVIRVATEPVELPTSDYAGPAAGERALMRAVLADAVDCMAGTVGSPHKRPQLAAAGRAWVVDQDRGWPFSFENICDALGFSADTLRTRILQTIPALPRERACDDRRVPARRQPPAPVMMQMIREGHPLRVVAERFGISIARASVLSAGLSSRIKIERNEEIRGLRRQGWTHRALSAHFRLSRVRVSRICATAHQARRREPCPSRSSGEVSG